jgi:hypothetical protein
MFRPWGDWFLLGFNVRLARRGSADHTCTRFSGIWGRNWLFFEPPPSGSGPIVSKLMHPDGTMNTASSTVGDYTNPILKPDAAEVLKKRGEIELSGGASADPHNAGLNRCHSHWGSNLAWRCCSRRTKLLCFI